MPLFGFEGNGWKLRVREGLKRPATAEAATATESTAT